MLTRLLIFGFLLSFSIDVCADIPWQSVVKRLADENEKLARRPQGHNGEYFVICTIYYTPMESGFRSERGFDTTLITKPGLRGHKYPRDFLRSVKMEGVGRLMTPVNGSPYIRYRGRNSYEFARTPLVGDRELVARTSAAAKLMHSRMRRGMTIELTAPFVKQVFGNLTWRIIDTGGGLRNWQVDLYYGEDEPLGPGQLMARPRSTTFEYEYSRARLTTVE